MHIIASYIDDARRHASYLYILGDTICLKNHRYILLLPGSSASAFVCHDV